MIPHKIKLIFWREYIVRLRKRSFWLTALLTPLLFVLMGLIPVLIESIGKSEKRIYVLDETNQFDKAFDSDEQVHFQMGKNPALDTANFAEKKQFDAILITLNTPGGMVTTTKDILSLFGESSIPVIIWIKPEGASATSAGAIIASGGHFIFMARGTNIGAATPVQMGAELEKKSDLRAKAVNDLVALVQGLSEARKRNGALFGKMISEAASFSSSEAKGKNLVNGILNSRRELFKMLDGKNVSIKGKEVKLSASSGLSFKKFKMDLGLSLLNIFANPSMAYVLFLIGAALIYLELQAPGGLIAGSLGTVSLILAAIAFQLLPLNLGALALIVVSFMLFVLEIYITSYGILSLGGLAALVSGSLFLFRTDDSYLAVSRGVIISSTLAIAGFFAFIALYWLRDAKKPKAFKSMFRLEGKIGTVIEVLESGAESTLVNVKVEGEIWKGHAIHSSPTRGDKVKILEKEEGIMRLRVEVE